MLWWERVVRQMTTYLRAFVRASLCVLGVLSQLGQLGQLGCTVRARPVRGQQAPFLIPALRSS
jgi:hypothetical protein